MSYLDGRLGCLLRLEGLDQLRARLEERWAAGDLHGRGGGGLSGGERRGERQGLRGQCPGGGEAHAGALVDLRGGRARGLRGWNGRPRGGGGGALHGAGGVHLVLEQVWEIPHLVADKLQHL